MGAAGDDDGDGDLADCVWMIGNWLGGLDRLLGGVRGGGVHLIGVYFSYW